MSLPVFCIRKSKNDQFYFVLVARNGKIVARSEEYKTEDGCRKGIASVVKEAPLATIKEEFDG